MKPVLRAYILLQLLLLSALTFSQPLLEMKHFGPEEGLNTPSVNCLAQDHDGFIWIGSNLGLTRFDGIHFHTYPITYNDEGAFALQPRQMTIDEQGQVLFRTRVGIFSFNPSTGSFTRQEEHPDSSLQWEQPIDYRLLDQIDWSGHLKGARTMLKDREGGVWIGSFYEGLFYLSPSSNRFSLITGTTATTPLIIRPLCVTNDGTVFVGTENRGLYKLVDGQLRQELMPTPANIPSLSISSNIQALVAHDDTLWIGTFGQGIYAYDYKRQHYLEHHIPQNSSNGTEQNAVVCMLMTTEGDLYAGTTNGLFVRKKGARQFVAIEGCHNGFIHALAQTADSKVWIGALDSQLRFIDIKKEPLKAQTDSTFHHRCITSLLATKTGALWIGTDSKGVWLRTPDGAYHKTLLTGERLASSANKLTLDADKRLWVSTFNGLFCMDEQQQTVSRYSQRSGLPTNFISYASGLLIDTQMLIGTHKGLVSFNPREFIMPNMPLQPFFTNVRIGEQDTLVAESLTIDYNAPSLTIDYAVPTFAHQTEVWYRYRIDNEKWKIVQGGNGSIYFDRLLPGTYQLTLQASMNPNLWEGKEAKFSIKVKAPWWRTPWAYVLYTLMILYTLWMLYRIHRERQRRKVLQEQIERLLQNQLLMRSTPQMSPYEMIKDITPKNPNVDDFMERVDSYLEAHIGDRQLGVDMLATHLGMSSSTFYRRMKSTTSFTPNEYIRLFRLKKAAFMLRQEGLSIREVSERLCFSSVAYFTNSFSQQFGVTPGEYVKLQPANNIETTKT
jgi:ligand-binding sensor domain-containing protein